jgi:hypothetical protein
MKLREWRQSAVKWDEYKAFHMLHGRHHYGCPIVQFDTGEVVIRRRGLRPDQRGRFDDMNIVLFTLRDNGLNEIRDKLRDPDGNKVCVAHLIRFGGAPIMLWDRDTNRVVTCSSLSERDAVPTRFRSFASAYFPGEGRPPVGGNTKISTPRKLTPEEKEHTETLIAACKAWHGLSEEGKQAYSKYQVPRRSMQFETALRIDFNTASTHQRAQIAMHGVDKGYTTRCVPYLQVC